MRVVQHLHLLPEGGRHLPTRFVVHERCGGIDQFPHGSRRLFRILARVPCVVGGFAAGSGGDNAFVRFIFAFTRISDGKQHSLGLLCALGQGFILNAPEII